MRARMTMLSMSMLVSGDKTVENDLCINIKMVYWSEMRRMTHVLRSRLFFMNHAYVHSDTVIQNDVRMAHVILGFRLPLSAPPPNTSTYVVPVYCKVLYNHNLYFILLHFHKTKTGSLHRQVTRLLVPCDE